MLCSWQGLLGLCWVRRNGPTPVFLPGESQGRGSLVGYHLWGHTVALESLQGLRDLT